MVGKKGEKGGGERPQESDTAGDTGKENTHFACGLEVLRRSVGAWEKRACKREQRGRGRRRGKVLSALPPCKEKGGLEGCLP